MSSLPLRYRLPNPPPVFVGRDEERQRLAAFLARGSLAYVWGLGGYGKSSLVSATVHEQGAEAVAHAVLVDIREGDDIMTTVSKAAAAVAGATGAAAFFAESVARSPSEKLAAALEIVDADPTTLWTIVLDDLHHASGDVAEVLAQLSRYARISRWIAVSRAAPPGGAAVGQTLHLKGLNDQALSSLARSSVPDATNEEVRHAAGGAGGSPWRLQQLIAGERPAAEPGGDGVLDSLDDATTSFLRALSVVQAAIPLDLARRFVEVPDGDVIAVLARRGVLERRPAGLRAHDVTRALLEADPVARPDSATRRRVARALVKMDDMHLVQDGLRILVELADFAAAAAVLEGHGDALLAPEMLTATAQLLRGVASQELCTWALRAAVEHGDATEVVRLGAPRGENPAELLLWARGLRLAGDLAASARVAADAAVVAAAAGDTALSVTAREFEVQCAMACSNYADARAILDELERSPAKNTTFLAVFQARCAVELDDAETAQRAVERLSRHAAAMSDSAAVETGHEVATALHHCGDLLGADALIARAVPDTRARGLVTYQRRLAVEVRAYLAVERGQLGVAGHVLESISAVGMSPFVRLFRGHIDATRRLYAGELDGLEPLLEQIYGDSRGRDDAVNSFITLGWALATLRNRADVTTLESRSVIPPGRLRAQVPSMCRDEYYVRRGARAPDYAALFTARDATVRVYARMLTALIDRVRDPELAVTHAREAAEIANVSGFGCIEARALTVLCDVLLIADRFDEAAAVAARLASLAEMMPSARFAGDARLYGSVTSRAALEPELLDSLAAQPDSCPIACRRARALLGGDPPLDLIDRGVVEAVAARARPWRIVSVRGASWTRGWTVDERARCVWLPANPEPVDLSRNPRLWRLLLALVKAPGGIDKEQLVRDVWDVNDYHPLRHDNKLHASIKNLRKRIEDDPARPSRIVTDGEGYSLGELHRPRLLTNDAELIGNR